MLRKRKNKVLAKKINQLILGSFIELKLLLLLLFIKIATHEYNFVKT
jgi:hypothetical protein